MHHRKCSLTQDSPLYNEMRLTGFDKVYIELLELFPGSSKDELTTRENALVRERGASLNILSSYKARVRNNTTQVEVIDDKNEHPLDEPLTINNHEIDNQQSEPFRNEALTEHQPQDKDNNP